MKKAQGLPITTVILAALGLVVLVIIFAITTGRLGIFSKALKECAADKCAGTSDTPNELRISQCRDEGGFKLPGDWVIAGSTTKCPYCCSVRIPTTPAPPRIAPRTAGQTAED